MTVHKDQPNAGAQTSNSPWGGNQTIHQRGGEAGIPASAKKDWGMTNQSPEVERGGVKGGGDLAAMLATVATQAQSGDV
jgi:hypothetical protein